MSVRSILLIMVAFAALALGAFIFPQIASAWLLNSANAAIARAATLPNDSPDRVLALTDADTKLKQANEYSALDRLSLAQARALLARGDAQGAVSAFDHAQASDPITEFVWADSAWQANQPAAAFEHWRRAGALTYFIEQAHRAAYAHDWASAAQLASVAVGIAPSNAEAHYVLGDAISQQDLYNPSALREIERAAELTRDPEFLSTIISRQAEILASQGKLRDALDLFNQARQVAPIDARPRTGYALTQLQLDPAARSESVALLEQVVGDSPWYVAAYVALADISELTGDVKGAEAWLQKGLARNPNDARLLLPLGELYVRQHRMDEARTTLILALKYETHADVLQEIVRKLTEVSGQ